MQVFKKPRGTTDLYGDSLNKFNHVVDKLKKIAQNFDFKEIVTPVFENLNLFEKSVGETTDIAQKELYQFQDKKGRWLALRPEGTSSVVRAYVEDKMYANTIECTKLFYILNLFRYERPQSGRQREFHQFGVEYLNANNHAYDIECILLANAIINSFNLTNNITLKINYLGDFLQRQKWIEELKKYFAQYKEQLTEDSINRIDKNPLRILDDKIDSKKDFVLNAPKLNKFLEANDYDVFNSVLTALKDNQINYVVDDSLVRGLDYYTGVVFEFVYSEPTTGYESTLIGGGGYANLIKQTGGPNQLGFGFAMGLERLVLALENTGYIFPDQLQPVIMLATNSEQNCIKLMKLLNEIRRHDIYAVIDLVHFKQEKCFKHAIKNKAKFFAFIEENVLDNNGSIQLENLITKEIKTIDLTMLISELKNYHE